MKSRFPPDLQVVVFGPVFLIVVALVVGSAVYHAAQWGWRPAICSCVRLRCLARRILLSSPASSISRYMVTSACGYDRLWRQSFFARVLGEFWFDARHAATPLLPRDSYSTLSPAGNIYHLTSR